MRPEEAVRIAELVLALKLPEGSVCLNVGASTRRFREVEQSHIDSSLMKTLQTAGIRLIHCDLKQDDGVDLVGDVLDPAFQARMAERRADLLLCCNLLEHLEAPERFAQACAGLVKPGGCMVVSVPLSYPYHPDPIDTMLRLQPQEIARFFGGWEFLCGDVVTSSTFLQESLAHPGGGQRLLKHLLKVLMPFYRPRRWWDKAHRTAWLFRPYKVSVAVLRKPATA